jgi:formyltetrahydrofolate synthetase
MEQAGTTPLRLRFEGVTPAEANRLADELDERLREITRGQLETRRRQEREDTQDLGATIEILVALLGTPFAVAIAYGIRDFIAKRGSRIVIETESGRVVANGDAATTIDTDALAAALKDPKAWATRPASST